MQCILCFYSIVSLYFFYNILCWRHAIKI
uniref:Uncharacterized protein n=1 Tax=Strongyloides stercoralis TaxID=6248 RepID=A0A0K0EA47_STRER